MTQPQPQQGVETPTVERATVPKKDQTTLAASQERVAGFIRGCRQSIPDVPVELSPEDRVLCAALLLEETIETIELGLNVQITHLNGFGKSGGRVLTHTTNSRFDYTPRDGDKMDMVEAVDGSCDVRYVTNWILTRLGVEVAPVDVEVEQNNLAKLGTEPQFNEHGKLIKPADHKPPRIRELLIKMGWKDPNEESN